MRSHRRDTGRTAFALRGLAFAMALVVGTGVLIAAANDALRPAPEVTAALPASAGPVRANSAVQYHGVTVGRLTAVDGGIKGSELRLRMEDDLAHQVPANVRVRVLPRTLFGDQYIDLAVPDGASPHGSLHDGAELRPDTSEKTVQLYTAYSRFYDVLTALRPADLQVAMTTLADTLRGKGDRLGSMVDDTSAFLDEFSPVVDTLDRDIDTIARLSSDVAAATPDLIRTLDNATALSRTLSTERESLGNLLGSGIDLARTSRRVISEHADRVVRLARSTQPISDVLSRHPAVADESLDAARFFLVNGARTFSTGNFKFDAALTLKQPFPYTAEDCPRYPGLAGQNCGQAPSSRHERTFPQPGPATAERGGTENEDAADSPGPIPGGDTGPVGGEREKASMRELGQLLPHGEAEDENASQDDRQDPSLLTLMLGPVARGQTAVVP